MKSHFSAKTRSLCRPRKLIFTHVEPPGNLVGFRTGSDVALEVDVVPFFEVGAVERAAKAQDYLWNIWNSKNGN
jgi:hypothetical protein